VDGREWVAGNPLHIHIYPGSFFWGGGGFEGILIEQRKANEHEVYYFEMLMMFHPSQQSYIYSRVSSFIDDSTSPLNPVGWRGFGVALNARPSCAAVL
jgi:hypothetical protein